MALNSLRPRYHLSLSINMNKPVLKTTLHISFQNCATHRVVSGVCCSKCSCSCHVLFAILYIHGFLLKDSLHIDRKWREGLVAVFSLGSSPTVDTDNRATRLQPSVNSPISVSGPVSVSMGFTKYKIKHDRNYFAMILDLDHQRTPLTTQ